MVYDVLPTTNLKYDDIRDTLNSAGGSVNNDVASAFKESANINMFARNKPVESDKDFNITDEDRKAVGHGITSPDTITSTNLNALNIVDASTNNWEYNPPKNKFRLGDFRGYYKDAVPPIQCNYPTNGWDINAEEGNLIINFDYDPNDSTYNLQCTDLLQSIDLRKCKIYAAVYKGSDNSLVGIYSTSDEILDETGEINGEILLIPISNLPQMQPQYRHRIYLCLCYFDSGQYYYIPLPKQGSYNPSVMYFNVIQDPISGGGGVEDPLEDVWFSPFFTQTYYNSNDATDEGGGNKVMRNTTGELLIQIKLTNTSDYDKIVDRGDFELYNYFDLEVRRYPNYIYNTKPAGVSGAASSITIPANGSVTIWMYFSDILSNVKATEIGTTVELDLKRSGVTIWNGALNYCYGTLGWIDK